MNDSAESIVYSKNVVEFVTVANEYCNFVENASGLTNREMVDKSLKLMSLIYLKASLLPEIKPLFDDEDVEKFVKEEDWKFIHETIASKLGKNDAYLELVESQGYESEEIVRLSIGEQMADVYQDIKDFITLYRLGSYRNMVESIRECKISYEEYWGTKLLSAQKALHFLKNSKTSTVFDDDIEEVIDDDFITDNSQEWSNNE